MRGWRAYSAYLLGMWLHVSRKRVPAMLFTANMATFGTMQAFTVTFLWQPQP